jgi:hypothetical protein
MKHIRQHVAQRKVVWANKIPINNLCKGSVSLVTSSKLWWRYVKAISRLSTFSVRGRIDSKVQKIKQNIFSEVGYLDWRLLLKRLMEASPYMIKCCTDWTFDWRPMRREATLTLFLGICCLIYRTTSFSIFWRQVMDYTNPDAKR